MANALNLYKYFKPKRNSLMNGDGVKNALVAKSAMDERFLGILAFADLVEHWSKTLPIAANIVWKIFRHFSNIFSLPIGNKLRDSRMQL